MDGETYVMDKGEEVRELVGPSDFVDTDTCAVDWIKFNGPVSTPNKWHSTFTEIFLHVSGVGSVYLDEKEYILANHCSVVVGKGVKHRFVVDRELTIYSVCLPFFDKTDLTMEDKT